MSYACTIIDQQRELAGLNCDCRGNARVHLFMDCSASAAQGQYHDRWLPTTSFSAQTYLDFERPWIRFVFQRHAQLPPLKARELIGTLGRAYFMHKVGDDAFGNSSLDRPPSHISIQ